MPIKDFIAVVLILFLTGCAQQQFVQTPSGQPELTLHNVDAKCVNSRFVNKLVDQGFNIKSTSETQIVAERQAQSFLMNVFLSSQAGGYPNERMNVLLIQNPGNNLRVVVSQQIVINPGTAFERLRDLMQDQQAQKQFETSAANIEAQCGRGRRKAAAK